MGGVTTKEVISELKRIKKKYKVDKMLLFGSRARNEELYTSDVDVIAVSGNFSKVNFKKRPNKFLDAWRLPVDLEIFCYLPEEFKRKQKEIGLISEAVKHCKYI